ncbi:MAG TPA: hypothetical protein VL854_04195 [Nitrososphaeraceae archaeon]|nr:hypothetical protein [Nitrososphaeraceae archaeon]
MPQVPRNLEGHSELAAQFTSNTDRHLSSRIKGKHASSTENRRMVWENVIWPLILGLNRSFFTLKEYQEMRDHYCRVHKITPSRVAGGFVSLLVKGILVREKEIYSIHYRLIPYMRKRAHLEYGQVIKEINTKR